MRKFNEQTPKSHKKIMDKYCQERWSREYHAKENEKRNVELKEFEDAYETFKLTGTISKEFGEKLFSNYKGLIELENSVSNWNDSIGEDKFFQNEKELKDKGYDVDEIYALYEQNYLIFEEY